MQASSNRWLHRYAVLVAACTFLLIFAGGLVTSTGSGLAVPDWPLSYGMVMPPMVGGILYEHGHRMIATAVGMLTIGLAIWLRRKEERKWLRRLGWIALCGVVLQGVLGGITVLFFLPAGVSVSHAGLAELFFATVVSIALFTSPGWKVPALYEERVRSVTLGTLTAVTAASIFVQILLGALMRHTHAGLAIPDFPLAFGRLIPPIESQGVAVHFAHRAWAVVVSALVVWTAVRAVREHMEHAELRNSSMLLFALLCGQITLGAMTIWSAKAVIPTTSHVAVGAAMWATSIVLALRARRHLAATCVAPAADVRVEGAAA
jgi:cytochrome c oxidase assembly protein subunit 15